MFSSRKRLRTRTTPKDLDRPDYLQALVNEFQEATGKEPKEQVLANLANFAYDPINYPYLRELHVIDLFIDCIDTDEDISGNIVQFGMGGLCNIVADATNRQHVIDDHRAIDLIIRCLSSSTEETVLSAITTLMQLIVPASRDRIVTPPVVECMRSFAAMLNRRFKNLAEIFLSEYCSPEERRSDDKSGQCLYIPLPTTK